MKRCLTCGRSHDENDKFCDADGTPLVEAAAVAGRGRKVPWWAVGIAALLAGAAVFIVALVALFYSSEDREGSPLSHQQIKGQDAAPSPEGVRRATPTPAPTEATPTPDQLPTPSPTQPPPPATPESPLATLSDSPASTSGSSSPQFVIWLDDGTSITADDAWRARDGVWYRRGGMVSLIDPARIRSIDRQQKPPTPEP